MRARVRVARRRRNYAEITPAGAVINFDRYRAESRQFREGGRDERACRVIFFVLPPPPSRDDA